MQKDAVALDAAATKLTALAKANDTEGFAAQFKLVADACATCHKAFRAQ